MPNAEGRMEEHNDASQRFEAAADAFETATGYLAIGKDAGAAYGGDEWQRQRTALWLAFRAGYDHALAARTREVEEMREDADRWRFIADRLHRETVHIGTVHARFSVTVEGEWMSLTEYVDAMLRRALAAQEGTNGH